MLIRIPRYYFSVINKIRQRQRFKQPQIPRIKTKPHQIGDFIGNATFDQRKFDLTPYQQYLIQTKTMERPYTGNLWGQVSPGFYHCAVCDTRLFTFDQKFLNQSGYASFYDCVQKRVTVLQQKTAFQMVNIFPDPFIEQEIKNHKRCQCAQCKSHIGSVLFDGPYPTFLRFAINSHALVFKYLPEFPDPNIARKIRQQKLKLKRVRYIR